MRVVIVDAGGANTGSVRHAFDRLGVETRLSTDAKIIRAAHRVVIPGVGNAATVMRRLRELDLVDTIRTLKQPVLGICVGMQILFERSEEGDIECLGLLRGRIAKMTVEGHRQFNPGWHLALDLRNMLTVSECVAGAALLRQESRGGHTRDDFPTMDAEWRKKLLVCKLDSDGSVNVTEEQQIPMREDLLELFEVDELKKYLTEEELPTA